MVVAHAMAAVAGVASAGGFLIAAGILWALANEKYD